MRRRTPARPSSASSAVRGTLRAGKAQGEERDLLDRVFAAVARYFAVLAEPTRLRILHAICQREQSVSAIVLATGSTQTNVSRHLSLMHAAGVVARRREGNVVFYRVADPELVLLCRSVCVQIAGRIEAGQPLRSDLLAFARRS